MVADRAETSTREGTEKYLSSGMIHGIGPVTRAQAVRIFKTYGTDVDGLMSKNPCGPLGISAASASVRRARLRGSSGSKRSRWLACTGRSFALAEAMAMGPVPCAHGLDGACWKAPRPAHSAYRARSTGRTL